MLLQYILRDDRSTYAAEVKAVVIRSASSKEMKGGEGRRHLGPPRVPRTRQAARRPAQRHGPPLFISSDFLRHASVTWKFQSAILQPCELAQYSFANCLQVWTRYSAKIIMGNLRASTGFFAAPFLVRFRQGRILIWNLSIDDWRPLYGKSSPLLLQGTLNRCISCTRNTYGTQ